MTLKVSDSDYRDLVLISKSTSMDYRYVIRAKIVLSLIKGESYSKICNELKVGRNTVSRWKKRFSEQGIAGLRDASGRGRKPTVAPETKARIIQLACGPADRGYSSWSQRRIAKEVGVSVFTVNKVLKEDDLKPHKVQYWCGKSTDPEFDSKMLNIVGLYMNPPENAIVLSVDEKTQMQALDRRQPELPLKSGLNRRQTTTYVRHGTVSMIAALAVHQGEITARTMDRNNSSNFVKFLKILDRKYRNKKLHIIVDNLSMHNSREVKEYLRHKRKFEIHFTPIYSSWLNQIEIWFNIMTKDVLKGGIWKSKNELVRQIISYIDEYNKNRAHPFVWTYDGTKREKTARCKNKKDGIAILKTRH